MSKTKYFTLLALPLLFLTGWFVNEIRVGYQYDNTIGSYWALGVKASTLQQKSAYLDQYVKALEDAHLSGNDAVMLKTPDNSYEQNMVALKSLQGRMHQIEGMDEQSFAYQTAMQQIAGQEQAQADQLTSTFEGVWLLQEHPCLWGWIELLIVSPFLLFVGVMVIMGLKYCLDTY